MKRKNCKICGEYSAKRTVCLKCKEEQPYRSSGRGGDPFKRIKMEKKKKEDEEQSDLEELELDVE